MAVSLVASSEANIQPGSTVSVTKPTGTTTGDILVGSVSVPDTYTVTPPAGFTQLLAPLATPAGVYSLQIFTKTAGGSEPATYDFGLSGSYWWAAGVVAFRGADVPSLLTTRTDASAGTITFPNITVPATAGYLLLLGVTSGGETAPITAPSTYADLTSGGYWPHMYGKLNPSTGANTPGAATYTSGTPASAAASVFIPAPAASVPVNTVAPALSATPQAGVAVSVSTGTWTNSPSGYAYQWKLNGSNIAGATTSSYTPIGGDVGGSLKCTVTASNGAGAGTGVDSDTQVVLAAAVGGTGSKNMLLRGVG
jgi:hypothetical protein